MNKEFKYEVMEHIGTVSESEDGSKTLEVNLISFNDADPKIDVRRWNHSLNRMLKGVTLSEDECEKLGQILLGIKKKKEDSDSQEGVKQ